MEEHGFGAHHARDAQIEAYQDSDDDDEEEDESGELSTRQEVDSHPAVLVERSRSSTSNSLSARLSTPATSSPPSRLGVFMKKLRTRSGSGSSSTLQGSSIGHLEENSPDRERESFGDVSRSRSFSSSMQKSLSADSMPPPDPRSDQIPEVSLPMLGPVLLGPVSNSSLRKSQSVNNLNTPVQNGRTISHSSSSSSLKDRLLGSPSKSRLRLETGDLNSGRSSVDSTRSSLASSFRGRSSPSKKNSPLAFDDMTDDEKREMLMGT